MDDFIDFYRVASNFKQREKDGNKPAKKYLKRLEALTSLGDLNKQAKDLVYQGLLLPFSVSVSIDDKHTDKKILQLSSPVSILPDVTYYEDKATKEQLLALYKKTALAVLKRLGYSAKEAEQHVKGALAFDEAMVPYLMSSEELSNAKNTINPRSAEDLTQYSSSLNLSQLVNDLTGQTIDQVNVVTLKYFENLNKIVTDKHFEELKSWIIISEAMSVSSYLDEETRQAASQYSLALTGQAELPSK